MHINNFYTHALLGITPARSGRTSQEIEAAKVRLFVSVGAFEKAHSLT